MKNINIAVVLEDARTITAQADGWEAAAKKVISWSESDFYTKGYAMKIFLADGINGLEEHTIEGLRNDLKTGRVQRADEADNADERRRFEDAISRHRADSKQL